MSPTPPSPFCTPALSGIWFPVPPGTTTLPTPPTPEVNASPLPINAATLPEDWDPAAPDLCYLFQDILPTNTAAVYPLVVTPGTTIPPYTETLPIFAISRTTLTVGTKAYALALPVSAIELVTRTAITLPPVPTRVSGTAAPILGATQANSTAAIASGWSLLYDYAADDAYVLSNAFTFPVYINNVSFTNCYIVSNSFLTFGASSVVYSSLSATNPAITKIHIGAGDWSYQRVYQINDATSSRIRWEGNSSTSGEPGSSDRFVEIAFYTLDDGTQLVDVRTGSIAGGTSVPLMIATASAALATATFAANQSWVFEGNANGTTWTTYTGQHVELV